MQTQSKASDGWLATEVDSVMRPAMREAARDTALAVVRGEDLPTHDPEVLVEALYELADTARELWLDLAEAADRMMRENDTAATDEARRAVKRLAKAGKVISAQLMHQAEDRGQSAA
jgi:hypothetical protein